MFVAEIENAFGINVPIFAEEIIELFSKYTRAYVFRLIKKAEQAGEIVSYSRGVYFLPRKTFFGQSTICSEMVAEKKYIQNKDSVYGIYAGLNLLNYFGLTTQVPNMQEIVTNNETSRKRIVAIDGKEFIIRKSRCKITSENCHEYTLLQLFNDIGKIEKLDVLTKTQIERYIRENHITQESLIAISMFFPAIAIKNMMKSGVLNGTL